MKKYTNNEFREKAFENTDWLQDILEEYDSSKEYITVSCKNGHVSKVSCKDLCRKNRAKTCSKCRSKKEKHYCLECGKELSNKAQTKFCSRSCSAKFNNRNRIRKNNTTKKYCLFCGKDITETGNKSFCSFNCQKEYEYSMRIKKWKEHPEDEKREHKISYIRRYLMEKYDCKCQLCGWSGTNPTTNKSTLEVHHINGISSDNREENLQLLCPNCHSLTPTYRSLNSGKGREKRF